MRKSIWILLLLAVLCPAVPAAALPAVVFEPAEARFITGMPFGEQRTTSVGVSLSGGTMPFRTVRAIRFEDGSALQDIGANYGYDTGLLVSADLADGGAAGKLTFSGEVPGFSGYRFYPIRVNLYADEDASDFIASADFNAEIAARFTMEYEELPPVTAGEPLDVTVNVTLADNLTGEESVALPLKNLSLGEPLTGPYKDLGLVFTPDPAASNIRITADAPVTGEELYRFIAESDNGTIEDTFIAVRVEEHTLTFSTPMLLAEATEDFDCYVTFDKRPASVPLSGFGVVMTISDAAYDEDEDSAPAFAPLSSDTGSLSWNGLTADLESDRLHIHGTAVEQWQGQLIIEGFLPNESEPRLTSVPLEIETRQFENGNLFDVENATVTLPGGTSDWGIGSYTDNILLLPLNGGPDDDGFAVDDNDFGVSMRDPSNVVTRLDADLAYNDDRKGALVIFYTPREPGNYVFEILYAINGNPYYELAQISEGGSRSSGGGCSAGAAGAAIMLPLLAFMRKKRN